MSLNVGIPDTKTEAILDGFVYLTKIRAPDFI
jgi:hypothetical protein